LRRALDPRGLPFHVPRPEPKPGKKHCRQQAEQGDGDQQLQQCEAVL
jgi:hypothetical protein